MRNQCSICWSCQTSAVILVTDGSPNEYDSTPTPVPAFFDTYAGTTYTSNCGATGPSSNCISPADGHESPVSRIAYWLNNTDLRPGLIEPVLSQVVSVSPISINLPAGAPRTSSGGRQHGRRQRTSTPPTARRSPTPSPRRWRPTTTGPTPSARRRRARSPPSTPSSSEAFITRFKPNEVAPFWEGHLYQVNLFDEFLNGCDPNRGWRASNQGHLRLEDGLGQLQRRPGRLGNAICTGVFMVDKDCDEITEYGGDPVAGGLQPGDFIKKGTGNMPANMVWDAGKVLSNSTQVGYRSAKESETNSRRVISRPCPTPPAASTWFPSTPWRRTSAKLAPFMNLYTAWCTNLLNNRAKVCGTGEAGVPACPASATDFQNLCARQVIHFVRGWDVTDNNANSCYGPDRGWTGTLKNAGSPAPRARWARSGIAPTTAAPPRSSGSWATSSIPRRWS